MAATTASFPPVRACIFDMDGLLINSEDIITSSVNELLSKYGRPALPTSIRVKMMGIPKSTDGDIFHNWAKLPITRQQFSAELRLQLQKNFPCCKPLPGAAKLLTALSNARNPLSDSRIRVALASTTTTSTFELKTSRNPAKSLLDLIPSENRVLGDDPRIRDDGSKPAPDIYLTALDTLNATLVSDCDSEEDTKISPSECLVFEDSIIGVEAGRRAGMRVIWVPHPDLAVEYAPNVKQILAGRSGVVDIGKHEQLGSIDDGWAQVLSSLDVFECGQYGITVID